MTAYRPRENSRVLLEAAENMPVVVLSGMRAIRQKHPFAAFAGVCEATVHNV